MKKLFIGALIALTTISFVSCGNNTQSSNNTATPVQNAEEETDTQAESVLYSDDNITVTCNGWKEDEIWGTYLDITVENHSDKNICVMLEDVSIGDTMCYSLNSTHVKAGKKAVEEYMFSDEVTEYTNLEATLQVFEYSELGQDEFDLTELYSAPINYIPQ